MSRFERAIVLLSGGLDSALNLVRACQDFSKVKCLTFDYGQRAAQREIFAATQIAKHFKLEHSVVELPFFGDFTSTSLVNRKKEVPGKEIDLESLSSVTESAAQVWVPNRNGILLNIAAGFAEGEKTQFIIPGFNAEEAVTFPDNTSDFCESLNHCFEFSTSNHVKVRCYTIQFDKKRIVQELIEESFPLQYLWPCYSNEEQWCGVCESCQRFHRALTSNGINYDHLQG